MRKTLPVFLLVGVLLGVAPLPALAIGIGAEQPAVGFLLQDGTEVPPVDEAISLDAIATDRDALLLRFSLLDGIYLYRHTLAFRVPGEGRAIQRYTLPRGTATRDEFFGDVEIYRGVLELPLRFVAEAEAVAVELEVAFQGCADAGVCYPPQRRTLVVDLE